MTIQTLRYAMTVFTTAAVAFGPATAGEMAIYNWADYFGETSVSSFEEATGIGVTLDYFDSNEVLETKLLAGGSGYDLVFPAASNAEREFQAGALMAIDPARLSNYKNLDPDILAALDKVPGGRKLGVPYTWGTIGIAYNPALIEARLGNVDMASWEVLFDPETAGNLADCGIAVLDSPIEMVSVTMSYLGKDPYSNDKADLAAAETVLTKAAGAVRYFSNQKATNDLASGDICLAVMYSGDAGIAQARAADSGNGVEIAYAIPKEGTLMWIDLMAIPNDAKNVDQAYGFIDHMLRPEVIAEVTNTVFFANANTASDPFVDPAIRLDPGIYPSDEVLGRLFPDKSVDAKAMRNRSRLWTKVKSGV